MRKVTPERDLTKCSLVLLDRFLCEIDLSSKRDLLSNDSGRLPNDARD